MHSFTIIRSRVEVSDPEIFGILGTLVWEFYALYCGIRLYVCCSMGFPYRTIKILNWIVPSIERLVDD